MLGAIAEQRSDERVVDRLLGIELAEEGLLADVALRELEAVGGDDRGEERDGHGVHDTGGVFGRNQCRDRDAVGIRVLIAMRPPRSLT